MQRLISINRTCHYRCILQRNIHSKSGGCKPCSHPSYTSPYSPLPYRLPLPKHVTMSFLWMSIDKNCKYGSEKTDIAKCSEMFARCPLYDTAMVQSLCHSVSQSSGKNSPDKVKKICETSNLSLGLYWNSQGV